MIDTASRGQIGLHCHGFIEGLLLKVLLECLRVFAKIMRKADEFSGAAHTDLRRETSANGGNLQEMAT